ncbi:hypothetical protein TruAng_000575 [Truncatella angustata]|nr:hypothetical protein TruAng_000575 [Truncatella angustata]
MGEDSGENDDGNGTNQVLRNNDTRELNEKDSASNVKYLRMSTEEAEESSLHGEAEASGPDVGKMADDRDGDGKADLVALRSRPESVDIELQSVNAESMTHTTALHVAVQNNDLKIIELLVRDGASIDTRQPDGKTPLLIAVENRNHGMIQLLLKLGANKSLEDTEGSTAIDLAEGHSTIIALLEAPQEI